MAITMLGQFTVISILLLLSIQDLEIITIGIRNEQAGTEQTSTVYS